MRTFLLALLSTGIACAQGTPAPAPPLRWESWSVTEPNTVDLSVFNTASRRKGMLNPERTVITMTSGKSDEVLERATIIKQ